MRHLVALFVIALGAWMPTSVAAYPDQTVKIVVAFPPGGPPDLLARLLAPVLSKELGQTFIVENKPGASGIIGTSSVSRATPDGYTIMVGSIATHASNAAMFKQLPYDPVSGFTPLALLAETPLVLVANPKFPAGSLADLLAIAKEKRLAFGSNSFGSTAHLGAELLQIVAGVKMVHVPFKGSSPLLVDVMSGQVPFGFDNLPSSLPFIRSGQIKVLAVTSQKRAQTLPDVPTFRESGITDYSVTAWYGLFAPPKLPSDVAAKLEAATATALRTPELRDKLGEFGFTILNEDAGALARKVSSEIKVWTNVVQTNGIQQQ